MTSILITVLNWNGAEDTIECIQSLQKQSFKDFNILIIDNGSKENDFINLSVTERFSNVTIVRNEKNIGFAGGVNIGIQHAIDNNYEFVALFNNDATADSYWLKNLVMGFDQDNSIAAVTGLLLHQKGTTIDSTGDYYSVWGMPFPRSRNNKTELAPDSEFVFSATGGATLYKTSLFEDIGLFDETFFAYYEDVDISFRAQLAGYKIYYNKDAVAYHKQGATSRKIPGFTVYQTFKNIPLLYAKNVPTGLMIPIGMRLLLLYWLMLANAIKKGSGVYAIKGWLTSVWYFWTKSIWSRFYIQKNKVVSNKYIKSLIFMDLPPDQTGMRKFRKKIIGKG
jgi:GT2 family glycosyltransferase